MKGYISLFSFLFLFFGAKAQNWETISSSDEYKIEKQHIICKSNQGFEYDYLVLRFTNLTNENVSLSFSYEEWYNDVCTTCASGGDEGRMRTLDLAPNQVLEGDCNSKGFMKIFHHSITVHPNAFVGKLTDLRINKIVLSK